MRCAQPLPGAMGKYSVHDEDVIKAARLTCPTEDLVIFDARSRVAAGGNMLKGKGTEDTVNRYKSCKLLFLDIANIHAMRESIDKLHKVCCNPSNTHWFSQLESSQWLNHCSSVLRGCYVIARHVEDRGVMAMIHCSDGWDRTSQLSSLAQLLLDSFYRTFDGFKLLVEKEWLAFGHKFEHRLGHPMHPSERSPVFLQFLDCTWQILHQFPTAFEFNEDYLLAIANHHNTGWFGTFLCNSNQERHRTFTNKACVSLWAYLDAQRGPLLNSTFVETTELLRPQTSLRRMQLWFTYLLQYDEASLAARSDMDEDSPQIPSKSSDTTVVVWVPNERAPQCHDCHQNFTTLRRKHHCRGCGQVFCGECTRQRIRLPKFGYYKPERVCDNCFHIYADDDADASEPTDTVTTPTTSFDQCLSA
ncbi:LOW QUALITY PROTEIN: myotubularin-related protein 2-like [Sycon ciliatum]|uniref:LOW QUALITY PROTEIN: myotubularin-related protein 2-like n=1 Tax=Sycon ciliatum TaxID=27933 RepID=UPI0031F69398